MQASFVLLEGSLLIEFSNYLRDRESDSLWQECQKKHWQKHKLGMLSVLSSMPHCESLVPTDYI